LISIQQTLRQFEEALLQPEVRRSPATVESLLADDFREFSSAGSVFNRQQVVATLQSEEPAERSIADFRASMIGDSAVLVTYRAATRQSGAVALSLRSSVWVMRNARWQLLFHQGTKAH